MGRYFFLAGSARVVSTRVLTCVAKLELAPLDLQQDITTTLSLCLLQLESTQMQAKLCLPVLWVLSWL